MTTTNQNAQHIAALLHMSRSPAWTTDNTLELSAATRSATHDEMAMALLMFTSDMLAAARNVVTIQRDMAAMEQVLTERDAQIGGVH